MRRRRRASRTLAAGAQDDAQRAIEPHLAQLATFEQRRLRRAQHRAPARRRGRSSSAKNAACDKPVHVLFVATQTRRARYPRCLVVAEAGCGVHGRSRITSALTDDAYFTNAVTEIVVAANARCATSGCSARAPSAFHIATCAVDVAQDAPLRLADDRARRAALALRPERRAERRGRGSAHRRPRADRRPPARRHAHADRPRAAERPQPRSCTRRSSAAPRTRCSTARSWCGRARSCTDSAQQSRNLLLSDKATRRHQAAARDFRRRREVRARRDRRPARRRAAVLPAEAAGCPSARRATC